MIDWKLSAELHSTTEGELRVRFVRYPKSAKKIVAICDVCNKERMSDFNAYRDLCNTCAHQTPEYREKRKQIVIRIFSVQEARDNMSNIKKQYYMEHPEAIELHRQLAIKQFSDPAAREAARLYGIERFATQESRDEMSDTMKISPAHKEVVEKMVGGDDIVEHHLIYDHSDLSKHAVPMTRSIHTKPHRLFQKHGIEIPHINIGAR